MISRENPARFDEIVGSVAESSPNEVDAIVWAADAAYRQWSVTPIEERLALLTAGAEAIEDALAELSVLLARETGKVLGDCRGEIGFAVRYLRWVVAHAIEAYADEVLDDELGLLIKQHKPYGVVAAITPWNAPVILSMLKIAPALAAGNAVVVKPSPLAPLTLNRIVRLIGGPLRIVHGGAAAGAALVGHELVRKVAFTGGAAGGRAVAALAGDRLTPSVLELGGNDPAVFLDDAPFDDASMDRLVMATFATSGQVCMAAKRLYVPSFKIADFVDAYRAAAARVLVTGDPLADGVTMGPVISAAAQESATAMRRGDFHDLGIFDADEKTGYFVRPTLVVSPASNDLIVTDEQFAPVVPVLGYESELSVIEMSNSGELGLGASVWSADEDRAVAFARRFEAGFCFINTHNRTGMSLRAPFGGVKRSGWGREYASEGLAEYVQTCVIHAPAAYRPGAPPQAGGPAAYPV
ncbi:acyl-CoA reductase-like NAD-dependent aldehyde dehydrogenase [Actinoplanes tereljensis]|uniref:aldehyde dehydrogenase (NAD(+)) n=1 Tax=Paractinoplanes tereljensis TaxID=571912 RepID=A0A919NWP3_9ACTN|nr:aldehyde dehydrogenase family protein [Actinoplanes tereljensis]GIF26108.1 aldehyde dehydrogenase [Actinoplanes tereljensis]